MNTLKPIGTVTLNDVEFSRLVFIPILKHITTDCKYVINPTEEEKLRDNVQRVSLSNTNFEEMESNFYMFVSVDCAFPIHWIINARSFEDAYEIYIDSNEEDLEINEEDLSDYNEDALTYSSNGVPVDTERVIGRELKLIEASN